MSTEAETIIAIQNAETFAAAAELICDYNTSHGWIPETIRAAFYKRLGLRQTNTISGPTFGTITTSVDVLE